MSTPILHASTDSSPEIFFIDELLPDLRTLLADLPVGAEVHYLHPQQDGFESIQQVLAGRSGLVAVHLLTHGAPGKVFAGSATLCLESMPHYAGALDAVANALVDDGELLVYGCEVAAGDRGQRFLQALRLSTGLRVAAASHKVGFKEMGGNWELDASLTSPQRSVAVSAWIGLLSVPSSFFDNLDGDISSWGGVGMTTALDSGTPLELGPSDWDEFNSGATLTVQRVGTEVPSDVFSFNVSPSFSISGNKLLSGVSPFATFATFANAGGLLTVTFNSSATRVLVQDVMRAVLYGNDAPAGNAKIQFILTDESGPTSADVTIYDSVYVTDISDTATVDLTNGISFSEAVAIANSKSGTQTMVFTSALDGKTVALAGDLSISESVGIDADAGGTFTLTGSVITTADGVTLTIHNQTGDQFTLASKVAGSATSSIHKTGAGKLTLSGTNSHSGAVSVLEGVLGVLGGSSIGDNSAVEVVAGASLSLEGGNETIGSLAGAGNVLLGYRLTLGGDNTSTTYSGAMSSSGANGFAKTGSGTFTLSGNNTYTGSTTVNAGVLAVSGGAAISDSSAVSVTSGATLTLGADEAIGSLAGAGAVSLGSYTLTTGGNNTNTTFSGIIDGTGNLIKAGSGALTLSGANSYTGSTTVSAGTLQVNGSLASGGPLAVGSGATLAGSGTVVPSVTIQSGASLAPGDNGVGKLTLSGGLTVEAGATVSLQINGVTVGTGYDQIDVTGTVSLAGATLSGTLGYAGTVGSRYVLINNDGSDAIVGTFNGLAEGAVFNASGYALSVSYIGGTGNDVVLTVTSLPDVTAPTLQSSTPADDATGVSIANNLTLVFSEDVVGAEGSISLKKSSDNTLVQQFDMLSGEGGLSISGKTITINPDADLDYSTGYYLEANSEAVKDAAGNFFVGIAGAEGLNFTTAAAPDIVAPTLQSSTPLDNATGVSTTTHLTLTFSENVLAGEGAVYLKNSLGVTVEEFNVGSGEGSLLGTLSVNGSSVTINPHADLDYSTGYYLLADVGTFTDATGNDFAGISAVDALNFTTAPAPTPAPTPTPTPTPTPDPVDPTPPPAPPPSVVEDKDGISAVQEDKVPGLVLPSGAVAGDGNGDGIKDSLQAQVASIAFVLSPTSQSNPGNSPDTFTTLVTGSSDGKVSGAITNSRITSLEQKDAPANLPAGLDTPMGLVAFTVELLNGASSESFSLYVDASLNINGYWKKGSSGVWVNLASEPYGGKMVMEGGRLRLDFKIADGGEFDADGKVDGVITDPGAPGRLPLSIVGMAPEVVGGGFWF